MAIVELKLLENTYKISCQDNEQDNLSSLETQIKERIQENFPNRGALSESHIFLMIAIMMQDEINELQEGKLQTTANRENHIQASEMLAVLDEITQYVYSLANNIKKM